MQIGLTVTLMLALMKLIENKTDEFTLNIQCFIQYR